MDSTSNNEKLLSKELIEHYTNHGVTDIESFIRQERCSKATSDNKLSTGSTGASSASSATLGFRFIRLNPRFNKQETLELLQEELNSQELEPIKAAAAGVCDEKNRVPISDRSSGNRITPIAVPWISSRLDFYAIPHSFVLSRSKVFENGRIYGMDVSSGAAIDALLLDDHNANRNNLECMKDADGKIDQNLRILDLCCAPGLKTCAIVDLLSSIDNEGCVNEKDERTQANIVIGVDISKQRIQLCRNIIKKYHIDPRTCGHSKPIHDTTEVCNASCTTKIQLFQADGTKFGTSQRRSDNADSLIFDSEFAREQNLLAGKRKRMNKSARGRERKKLKTLGRDIFGPNDVKPNIQDGSIGSGPGESSKIDNSDEDDKNNSVIIPLFDRVLVDAECSTDGAIRHLQHKYKKLHNAADDETDTFHADRSGEHPQVPSDKERSAELDKLTNNSKLTNATLLEKLVALQKQLIESGFRLLKKGGILVYSTCSLAREQNEDVVSWLLERYPDSNIVPLSFTQDEDISEFDGKDKARSQMISEGSLKGTVRFHPSTNQSFQSSAFFGGGFFLSKITKLR